MSRARFDALRQLVDEYSSSGKDVPPQWIAELQTLGEADPSLLGPPIPTTVAPVPPVPPLPPTLAPTAITPVRGDRVPIILDDDHPDVTIRQILRVWAMRFCVYENGGQLVEIREPPNQESPFSFSEPRPTTLIPLNPIRAWLLAGRECVFGQSKTTKHGTSIVNVMPPMWIGPALCNRNDFEGIPSLSSLSHAPTLRKDGALISKKGFDLSTNTFLTKELPLTIPEQPTVTDARVAYSRLRDLVCDFDFSSEAGASSWVASVLSLVARHTFDGPSPIFIFDASRVGSGKTLLADLAHVIATGSSADRMVFVKDPIEMDKRITALALSGEPSALLDNVKGKLASAPLDAAVTGNFYRSRILGKSEMPVKVPMKIVWFVTGNGLVISTDIARRSLIARLTPSVDMPYLRSGPKDGKTWRYPKILEYARRQRAELLGYALTIVKAYICAGRPAIPDIQPLGSFEAWSDTIRSAILFAGGVDPCMSSIEVADADLDDLAVRRMIACWPVADDIDVTAEDLVNWAQIVPPMDADMKTRSAYEETRATRELWRSALLEWLPPKRGDLPTPVELGYALRELKDAVISDFRVVAGKRSLRGILWKRVRMGVPQPAISM